MGDELPDDWTYEEARAALDLLSDRIGEWQGIPVPVEDLPLRLCEGHPLAGFYDRPVDVRVIVGGPDHDAPIDPRAEPEEIVRRCIVEDGGEQLVNEWYDGRRNRDVLVFRRGNGRAFALAAPRSPDRSMERLMLWVRTIGASDAWDLEAEYRAREKLAGLLSERQWRHYDLTGSFLETSPRSQLTYVFRRLRPTVALTPRWKWWGHPGETMRCLAVLCLHPVGYYDQTWGGCMVPSDDVIAHLLLMRGDEALFWRKANQHQPSQPEAGI